MELLFRRAEFGGLGEQLFAWLTGGPYSNVQIRFKDHKRFGVDFDDGTLMFEPPYFEEGEWDSFKIFDGESLVREYCEENEGRRVRKGRFIHLKTFLRMMRFNGKFIADALEGAGYDNLPKGEVWPNELGEWIQWWLTNHPYYPPVSAVKKETLSW